MKRPDILITIRADSARLCRAVLEKKLRGKGAVQEDCVRASEGKKEMGSEWGPGTNLDLK